MEHKPETTREIVEALRELATYHLAQAQTLHALLATLEPEAQQAVLARLEAQAATAEPPGLPSAAAEIALTMAKAVLEGGPPLDPDQLLRHVKSEKGRE